MRVVPLVLARFIGHQTSRGDRTEPPQKSSLGGKPFVGDDQPLTHAIVVPGKIGQFLEDTKTMLADWELATSFMPWNVTTPAVIKMVELGMLNVVEINEESEELVTVLMARSIAFNHILAQEAERRRVEKDLDIEYVDLEELNE